MIHHSIRRQRQMGIRDRSSTGYELTIAGDMDIAFFPSVSLTLNDVRLKNPASPQELASTTAALLQVDLRALISGEICVLANSRINVKCIATQRLQS